MGRTPVDPAKRSVSSESVGVTEAHLWIVRLAEISWTGVTSMGSKAATEGVRLP